MKNGAKFGMIILLVLALALAGAGVAGIVFESQERNAQPSAFDLYQEESAQLVAESEGYLAVADEAIGNINSYLEQMNKNAAAYTAAGGDAANLEAPLKAAADALASAETQREKMIGDFEKLKASTGLDGSDAAAIDKARSTMPKRLNTIVAALRKITKIDEVESASNPSSESILRKQAGILTDTIAAEFPDLDLGDQFTVTRESAEAQEDIPEPGKGFKGVLQENWQYAFWLGGLALIAAALCAIGWKKPATLKKIGAVANKNMMLVALVIITLLFFVLTKYKNLTPANIYNIINQYSYIIILATGMLLCIVSSANIDLSVGRVMGFIAACAAKFIIDFKMNVPLSMMLCLLIGIAIGAWQGFWIAYVKIPAFVVTLAGQLTFYGLTMVILKGETIAPFPATFNNVFSTALPDFIGSLFGIQSSLNITTMLIGILVIVIFIAMQLINRASRLKKGYEVQPFATTIAKIVVISAVLAFLFYSLAANKGLPTVLITVSLVVLIYTFITSKTVIGRHLYAMGGNVNAARLSGVKTQRMLFLTYVNMGFLAALAGLAFASRMNSASPMGGQGEELNAIAACYIGGASAYGGIGTVGGAVIGALTMGMIKNGMSMMGMQQDIQQVVLGMVLLVAVVVDIISKSNGTALPFLGRLGARKEKKSAGT